MANKSSVTSAPLFGAATPSQISDIQKRIRQFTQKHTKTSEAALAMLAKVGALPDETV